MTRNGGTAAVLKLLPNRVRRTYRGGRMIDKLQHRPHSADGERPEEWIVSTVSARNAGMPPEPGEGQSSVNSGERTDAPAVPFFSLEEYVIATELDWESDGGFAIGILVEGELAVATHAGGAETRLQRGGSVFFPAERPRSVMRLVGAEPARLLVCRPPRATPR